MKNYQTKFFFNLIFSLVLVGGVLLFGILPLINSAKEKINHTKVLKGQIKQEKEKSQKISYLEEVYTLVSENKNKIEEALPEAKNSGKLLAQMEFLAQREGCVLSEFKFSQETQKTSKKKEKEKVLALPFTFTLEAPYASFLKFLEGLDRFPRIIKIETVSLETNEGKIKANFTANAYYKNQ